MFINTGPSPAVVRKFTGENFASKNIVVAFKAPAVLIQAHYKQQQKLP